MCTPLFSINVWSCIEAKSKAIQTFRIGYLPKNSTSNNFVSLEVELESGIKVGNIQLKYFLILSTWVVGGQFWAQAYILSGKRGSSELPTTIHHPLNGNKLPQTTINSASFALLQKDVKLMNYGRWIMIKYPTKRLQSRLKRCKTTVGDD